MGRKGTISERMRQNMRAILEYLIKHEREEATAKEIRDKTGLTKKQMLNAIKRLRNLKLVELKGKGVYGWDKRMLRNYYFEEYKEPCRIDIYDILSRLREPSRPSMHLQEEINGELTGIELHLLDLDEYGMAKYGEVDRLLYEIEKLKHVLKGLYRNEGEVQLRQVFGLLYWVRKPTKIMFREAQVSEKLEL
ncbi:MAG: winged helix DNA-binding protein [Candidatus Bathyarchaeia archaeon]